MPTSFLKLQSALQYKMPCEKGHSHPPWPKQGMQVLFIEGCETQCGWCDYRTRQANNLRVHAGRHIANPSDENLHHITIVRGKVGRPRVQIVKTRPEGGQENQDVTPHRTVLNFPTPNNDLDEMGDDQGHVQIALPDSIRSSLSGADRRLPVEYIPTISTSVGIWSTEASTAGTEHRADLRDRAELSEAGRSSTPSGQQRRHSASYLTNRDYNLGLADPEYEATSGNFENRNKNKLQKHPATFQCNLCPRRFTRAHSLRSHLRTHTDERPFACTVCGKVFARQHDRKRHEGLHSGEKKFICKGDLKVGNQWGCGRRFARAGALGRHFRSEAGRICIKPLLDEEEAMERERAWQEQSMRNMENIQQEVQSPKDINAHDFPMDAASQIMLWPQALA